MCKLFFCALSGDHVATLSDRSFAGEKSLAAPRLHKTIADPRSRRVRFSTSAIARVDGGRKKRRRRPIFLAKTADLGSVESFMRPTKRVARLRATNNSCLYPFFSLSSSSSLLFSLSLSFVSSLSAADTRAFLPLRFLSASFVRRSNSNSCRKKPGDLSQPNAFTFEESSVPVPNPMGPLAADIISDPYLSRSIYSDYLM